LIRPADNEGYDCCEHYHFNRDRSERVGNVDRYHCSPFHQLSCFTMSSNFLSDSVSRMSTRSRSKRAAGSGICTRHLGSDTACGARRPGPGQHVRASSSACLAQRSEHRAWTAITICSSNGFLVYWLCFLFQQLTVSNVLFLLQSRKENRTGNQETKTIACVGSLPPRH